MRVWWKARIAAMNRFNQPETICLHDPVLFAERDGGKDWIAASDLFFGWHKYLISS